MEDSKNKKVGKTILDQDKEKVYKRGRKSQTEYSEIFFSSPNLMAICSLDQGRFINVNSTFLFCTGHYREEVVGFTPVELELIDKPTFTTIVWETKRQKRLLGFEFKFQAKSGEIRNGMLSTQIIDLGGERCVLAVVNDITEQKQTEDALRKSEQRYRMLANNMSEGIYLTDANHKILFLNPAIETIFGRSLDFIMRDYPRNYLSSIHPEDRSRAFRFFFQPPYPENQTEIQYRILRNNGEVRYLREFLHVARDDEGEIKAFQGLISDITEQKKAEEALRSSEERYRAIVEDQAELVCRFLPDGTLSFANEAFCRYFGKTRQQVLGSSITDFISNQEIEPFCNRLVSESQTQPVVAFDHQMMTEDGAARWQHWTNRAIINDEGILAEYQAVGRDVTERKRMEEQLRYMSIHDALTGLYNRAYFEEAMERLQVENGLIGLVVCDVDGLKLVNDTLGHHTGDQLLIAAAQVIKECFRHNDVVTRIGGDEFVILLPNTNRTIIENVSDRIQEAAARFNSQNPEFPLSLSVGYAIGNTASTPPWELFKKADNNMYREKLRRSHTSRSTIIQALMNVLARRKIIFYQQTKHLQDLVSRMAVFLGLSDYTQTNLHLLAEFRNIGMVGIAKDIVSKKEPLTPEEQAELRRHCEIGHRIVLSSPELVSIADLILKHHEWWNGQGYPLGLQGDEIPLECRILAIARAYQQWHAAVPQKARTHQEAVHQLRLGAGIQFDPILVKKFIQIIESNPNLRARFY